MDEPTADEMRIASGALEKEATKWDNEAPTLTSIATTLAGLEMSRIEAGLFQIMFGPYEQCRATVEDRAREGAAEFATMADTLTSLSKAYRDLDSERADSIAQLKW
jgi:hypothetical protein